MSIFSKAKSVVKKVGSTIKKVVSNIGSAIKGSAQSAVAGLGVNTLKNQTTLAPRTPAQISNSKTYDISGKKLATGNSQSSSNALSAGQFGGATKPSSTIKVNTTSGSGTNSNLSNANVPNTFEASSFENSEAFSVPQYNSNINSSFSSSNGDGGIGAYLGASAGSTTNPALNTTLAGSDPFKSYEDEVKKREKENEKAQKDLIKMMNQLEGKPAEEARLAEEAGIPQIDSEIRDLSAKQSAETAQYLSSIQNIQNKPIAMEFIAGQQGEEQRRYGINALITSSLLQAKSGQLSTAQATVDRALSLKYDPLAQRIKTQQQILEFNSTNLSRADKALADKRLEVLNIQKNALDYDRDVRKNMIDNIYSGMNNGTIDLGAGTAQIQTILNPDTKLSDVYKSMGITGEGNPGIVNGYDITSYATDPNHESKINAIVESSNITNSVSAQEAIDRYVKNSPITGAMIINSANKYKVDPNVMFALMLNDSSLGTAGRATKTFNPGNVGNVDSGASRNYGNWANGVDAVGEWLSRHKAKNLYNGEFGDTLANVVNFEPQKSQKGVLKNLQNQVASGNYKGVYTQIQNSVSKGLTGENKTRYDSARIDVGVLNSLKDSLKQYEALGGNTNLLKGSVEKITRKLGALKTDTRFAELAVQMEREFQNYRNQMTGAAFSPEESREYDAVNPSGKKSFNLNYAVINGAVNQLKTRVYSTEEALVGDGARYIREYAMGIDPLLQSMSSAVTGNEPTVSNSDFFNNL